MSAITVKQQILSLFKAPELIKIESGEKTDGTKYWDAYLHEDTNNLGRNGYILRDYYFDYEKLDKSCFEVDCISYGVFRFTLNK